jgi:hypothetical protein
LLSERVSLLARTSNNPLKEQHMGRDSSYDKGQSDGSQNHYDPPVHITPLIEIISSNSDLQDYRDANDSYDKGWTNGYKQS